MKQKKLIVKALLMTVITVFLCMNGYSYIAYNGAGGGYGGGGEGNSGGSSISSCSQDNEIEYFIMLGAGHYLDAKTDIQQLLKVVEWQDIRGVNYFEMQVRVENALFHMKNAAYIYEKLIAAAEVTPYNEAVQVLLKGFDYDAFMLENGLNKGLFDIVRQHLQDGDITGIFKRTHFAFINIIQLLVTVKKEVYNNKMPNLSIFWQLNETLANTSTIGSYAARIFAAFQ